MSTTKTELTKAWVLLSKPIISQEDIIEVRKILDEQIQLQQYYEDCAIESKDDIHLSLYQE